MIKFLTPVLIASSLMAGVYLVPTEYDNMLSSIKSKGYTVISNTSSSYSGNSYQIGGKILRYKCSIIPKITCGGGRNADITANISESSLKDASEVLVQSWQLDLRIENDNAGKRWYLCGAGYGGQVWDDSTLTSTTDASGNTQLNYKYSPNAKIKEYFYFTNLANSSSQSFLSVSYEQVCR